MEWAIWAVAVLLNVDDPLTSLARHLENFVQTQTFSFEDTRTVTLNKDIRFLDEFVQF